MRIAITGAGGFIGVPLQQHLREAGHAVLTIGRARGGGAGPDVTWDPTRGTIDSAGLAGVDAVIHLAGASIAQRWTPAVKRDIRESRVQGTTLIARTVADLEPKPRVLVSMSAVGIYGDREDEVLDESSPPGRGFLADTAQEWEGAADAARQAGVRVVHPRVGIVLHRSGGALERMVPIFALGAGGRVGSGKQWMSWIARPDVLAALAFMLETPALEGPVNVTSPNPAQNEAFTKALARVLGRPALAIAPEFAIRLLYGEMGVETVIAGQRVLPAKLLDAGFQFRFPELEGALREAIG